MTAEQGEGVSGGKRDFLKYVLGGSFVVWLGSVLYPMLAYLKPPHESDVEVSSIKAAKVGEIENRTAKIVRFGNKPVILLRLDSGEFRAFEATCTHLDCTVQYRHDMGIIWCACHNGKYDLMGRNIGGPPPRPLAKYKVVVQGEDVLIVKGEA
jgi:Rieske Fe-S protein